MKIEIDQQALLQLLQSKALSLNDFRCTDKETKAFVWRSYLKGASNNYSRSVSHKQLSDPTSE